MLHRLLICLTNPSHTHLERQTHFEDLVPRHCHNALCLHWLFTCLIIPSHTYLEGQDLLLDLVPCHCFAVNDDALDVRLQR